MKNYDLTLDQMWDALQQVFGVSNQTLQVVTDINGYSEETLLDILYAVPVIAILNKHRRWKNISTQ